MVTAIIKNGQIVHPVSGCPIHMQNGQLFVTSWSGVVGRYAGDPAEYTALLAQLPTELKIINPEAKIEQK